MVKHFIRVQDTFSIVVHSKWNLYLFTVILYRPHVQVKGYTDWQPDFSAGFTIIGIITINNTSNFINEPVLINLMEYNTRDNISQ